MLGGGCLRQRFLSQPAPHIYNVKEEVGITMNSFDFTDFSTIFQ